MGSPAKLKNIYRLDLYAPLVLSPKVTEILQLDSVGAATAPYKLIKLAEAIPSPF